ncbi:amidohydrolase family protein [Vibrio hangzhouensis]|uniref:amidohydrolase family protein n=1 Tax=Vibrio hangzhouensis TaxID=462991 RepID=UPI001C93FA50|nr:amidohydrolase family protein [Vibrio hangzhouensis]MBY6196056.1 amidohydrolase family protein [Vibrio hangzhouensis]
MFKKTLIAASLAFTTASAFAAMAPTETPTPMTTEAPQVVVFENVNIFNGTENKLYSDHSVVVTGNKITAIAKGKAEVPANAKVIDGEGRTLMPALVEAHMHLALPKGLLGTNDMRWSEIAVHAKGFGEMYLDLGFGTIRDVGGADGVWTELEKRGEIDFPRTYVSGAPIAPIGGHSDVGLQSRRLTDSPQNLEILGIMSTPAGVAEIHEQARHNYRQGGQFTKVFQSGGVSSKFDPWQYQSLLDEELKAAVDIAESYGSYVATHAYSDKALHQALDMGVKSIEHGFMFNESHHKKFKQNGAFLVTNLTAFSPELAKVPVVQDPSIQKKLASAQAAFDSYIENVQKLDPDYRAFNTDCVGYADICAKQISHEIYLNAKFFGNFSALRALTSTGGRISSELMEDWINPYSDGKIGVIEVGAYADILLIDGNPLEDITLIGGRETWLTNDAKPDGSHLTEMDLIMKDGKIFKNTL